MLRQPLRYQELFSLAISGIVLFGATNFCLAQSSPGRLTKEKSTGNSRDLSHEAKEVIAWAAKTYRIEIVWKNVPYPILLREERKISRGNESPERGGRSGLTGTKSGVGEIPSRNASCRRPVAHHPGHATEGERHPHRRLLESSFPKFDPGDPRRRKPGLQEYHPPSRNLPSDRPSPSGAVRQARFGLGPAQRPELQGLSGRRWLEVDGASSPVRPNRKRSRGLFRLTACRRFRKIRRRYSPISWRILLPWPKWPAKMPSSAPRWIV